MPIVGGRTVLIQVEWGLLSEDDVAEALLLIDPAVLVTVFVDVGKVTVVSTVPTTGCVVVVKLDCVEVDHRTVMEVALPVPVTRGIVVKLKEGNGVKTRGIVNVVVDVVWLSDPVPAGKEVALIDRSGGMEDTVPLLTELVELVDQTRRVLVEEVCVTSGPDRLNVVSPVAEVKVVCEKWDVTVEEFTDVLIATVASDVDVDVE